MSRATAAGSGDEQQPGGEDRPMPVADHQAVRQFHRHFATGVTVVTAMQEGEPRGLAVNAFASVSLEPPVVMVCVANQAATAPALHETDHIAINMLAADQVALAQRFAHSGGDKFAGLDWQTGSFGAPVLGGVTAHLEAEIEQRLPAYTHTIFLARVLDSVVHDRPPMVYLDGRFHSATALNQPNPS